MAWETRGGAPRYYTRTRCVQGKFTREYVGGGARGHQAAAEDILRRADRAARKQAWLDALGALDTQQKPVADLAGIIERVSRAVLFAAGFHQHARTWRKRHVQAT